MKYISVILLLAMVILSTGTAVFASDDHRDGYRSKFYGKVELLPGGLLGTWVVNGRSVEVDQQTRIEEEYGRAAVGAYVKIEGRSDGQIFHATELEVKQGATGSIDDNSGKHPSEDNKFYGTITTIPQGKLGVWVIDDREVFVDEGTRIESKKGRLIIGATVKVKGHFRKGLFYARKIEAK